MKIIAIGRNYKAHAEEMGNQVPDEPLIFFKPQTALLKNKMPFILPSHSRQVEYEVEIVLRVCRNGRHIQKEDAPKYYNEIGIGIDFTARDIQQKCKENGWPWEIAKSFDGSAPVSPMYPLDEFDDIFNLPFSLKKNGEIVQEGNTADMLYDFNALISHISNYFTLNIGDLIFTGTPEGVGPVKSGDVLEAFIGTRSMMTCLVRSPDEQQKRKYRNREARTGQHSSS